VDAHLQYFIRLSVGGVSVADELAVVRSQHFIRHSDGGVSERNNRETIILEKAVDRGVKCRKPSSPALPPEGEGSKYPLLFGRARVRVKPCVACLRWLIWLSIAFSRIISIHKNCLINYLSAHYYFEGFFSK
jgi:hypothetical protein